MLGKPSTKVANGVFVIFHFGAEVGVGLSWRGGSAVIAEDLSSILSTEATAHKCL